MIELARIAFADVTDVIQIRGGEVTVRDTAELTEGQRAAIASIEETKSGLKVRMHSKAQPRPGFSEHGRRRHGRHQSRQPGRAHGRRVSPGESRIVLPPTWVLAWERTDKNSGFAGVFFTCARSRSRKPPLSCATCGARSRSSFWAALAWSAFVPGAPTGRGL